MGPIKATNWAFRILLSLGSVSDIVQPQDLHHTAFISSLNWDVGRAIKSRKGSLTKYCRDSLVFDTAVCGQCSGAVWRAAQSDETLNNGLPLQKVNPGLKQFNWAQ